MNKFIIFILILGLLSSCGKDCTDDQNPEWSSEMLEDSYYQRRTLYKTDIEIHAKTAKGQVENVEWNILPKGAAVKIDTKKKHLVEGHQEAEYTSVDHHVAAMKRETEPGIIET